MPSMGICKGIAGNIWKQHGETLGKIILVFFFNFNLVHLLNSQFIYIVQYSKGMMKCPSDTNYSILIPMSSVSCVSF